MMGRATRHVVPPIRKIKLDRVYAQPWGPLYPRERKSFGEPFRSERCQKQKFTPNNPYSLLRAIRPRGRSRHLAVLAQPVQGLMLTEAA